MTALAGIDIETHDLRTAAEPVLEAVHALEAGFEVEFQPDDPPTPFETFRARYRPMPSHRDTYALVAVAEGETVGTATVDLDRTGNNAHILECFVVVDPPRRRQGVARRLLADVVDLAETEGRTSLLAYTAGSVPTGAAFMESLGAAAGLVERESELNLTDLDRSLVRRWVEEGPERAAPYELLLIEDRIPEELLAPFAELYAVTNTAPRDDLEMDDEFRTPEQVRDSDHSRLEAGNERILCVARHRDSGALAGWTELAWHPAQPWRVNQFWTAVHPDHRGHALGKWLKAANIVRTLERWPEAKKIVTGNAYSNDAMLGINNELGFKETAAWTVWQVTVARLREYLSATPNLPQ